MSRNNEPIEVSAQFLHDRGTTVLVTDDGKNEIWLPVSQCESDPPLDRLKRNDLVTITLPEWLASDRGLI